ncbi:MAG: tRNA guanosine(34) transglycosylase Tgt [bacterium]
MLKIIKQSKNARLGVLTTAHGKIQTPAFMPVATQGAVKFLTTEEIKKLGFALLLSNTYHLMLRPGAQQIKKMKGLHRFMNWSGAILTDSGGFQVFSLSKDRTKSGQSLVKITDKGVKFKSYIDGSSHELTPAKALQIQTALGVDLAVCLDECVALPASQKYLEQSVALTTKWAQATKQAYNKLKGQKPLLLAVIQGGLNKKLRLQSLNDLVKIGFDGYNIGGLSVGEKPQAMYQVLDYLVPAMPADKLHYLMGVGYPENILEAVKRGVDLFDCVIPTREGRHGRLFFFKPTAKKLLAKYLRQDQISPTNFYTSLNLTNAKFATDQSAINAQSKLLELRNYTKAYLHYLLKVGEPLGQRLATLNNLEFYSDLMKYIREGIK